MKRVLSELGFSPVAVLWPLLFLISLPAGQPLRRQENKGSGPTLSISVVDKSGKPISGLVAGDFSVQIDKLPAKIGGFRSPDSPASAVFLIDTSASMHGFNVAELAVKELKRVVVESNPANRYQVVTFNAAPAVALDWTSNLDAISAALTSAAKPQSKRATALYDALILAINDLAQQSNDKKFVILIEGGLDTSSKAHFSDARRVLQQTCVPVYTIGLTDPGSDLLGADQRSIIEEISSVGGGVTFFPGLRQELAPIFERIARWTRGSYEIGLDADSLPNDGKYHKLAIKLNREAEARVGEHFLKAPKGLLAGKR